MNFGSSVPDFAIRHTRVPFRCCEGQKTIIMGSEYRITYWDRLEGQRNSLEINDFPKLPSARKQLRERGYLCLSGNAAVSGEEQWHRLEAPDDPKPVATIQQL